MWVYANPSLFCDASRRGYNGPVARPKLTPSDGDRARRRNQRPHVTLAIDVAGSYGRGVLGGVMAWAKTHDWLVDIRLDDAGLPDDWGVDGLIAQAITKPLDRRIARECRGRGVPVTNVSNMFGGSTLPSVLPDDEAVGRLAMQYLAGRGFKQFGFYGYRDRGSYSERRRQGFAAEVCAGGRASV